MPLISVSANDIDAAGLGIETELPPAWLDAELGDASVSAKAPGHVTVRLSRTGEEIVVRGRVRASLSVPCARCTDPSALEVDTELTLLLQPAPAAKGAKPKHHKPEEEYEFTSAEADVDTYDGETVVLDGFVREAILLEVPNFPLCSEACPGIRPAAEPAPPAEPPLDPRLSPLAALRAKLPVGPVPNGAANGEAPRPKTKKNKE
jgi:uncharacterized protein